MYTVYCDKGMQFIETMAQDLNVLKNTITAKICSLNGRY